MEYRKKICKWGNFPATQDLHVKACFLNGFNQELLLAPNSNLRFSLSKHALLFWNYIVLQTLQLSHCIPYYFTALLLYPPIETLKISQPNVPLPTFP